MLVHVGELWYFWVSKKSKFAISICLIKYRGQVATCTTISTIEIIITVNSITNTPPYTVNGLIFNDKATIQLPVVGTSTVLVIESLLLHSRICTAHTKATISSTTVTSSFTDTTTGNGMII